MQRSSHFGSLCYLPGCLLTTGLWALYHIPTGPHLLQCLLVFVQLHLLAPFLLLLGKHLEDDPILHLQTAIHQWNSSLHAFNLKNLQS
jgi:hypothetical protein